MPIMGVGRSLQLRTILTLSNKQFLTALSAAEAKTQGFTAAMQKAGPIFAAVAGGIAVALGLCVKAASDFEEQMLNMDSVARTTATEFERLRGLALDLATESVYGAAKLAEAQYWLASAGQRAGEIMQTLPGTVALATATHADLASVTETVVSTLKAFRMEAGETNRVVNVMAAVIGSSLANMEKLTESMKYAAPMAHAAGISIEETAAALGMMYDLGLQGSQAGTSFRRIVTALLRPNEAFRTSLRYTNLEMKDFRPEIVGLGNVLENLNTAFVDAGDMIAAFGIRGATAILGMTSLGKEYFDELLGKVTDTNNAYEMAQRQMQGASNQFKVLKNSIGVVAIEFGTELLPVVKEWIDKARDFVLGFREWSPAMKRFALDCAGTTLKLTAFLAMVAKAAPMLGAVAGPLALLGLAMAGVSFSTAAARKYIDELTADMEEFNTEVLESLSLWQTMVLLWSEPPGKRGLLEEPLIKGLATVELAFDALMDHTIPIKDKFGSFLDEFWGLMSGETDRAARAEEALRRSFDRTHKVFDGYFEQMKKDMDEYYAEQAKRQARAALEFAAAQAKVKLFQGFEERVPWLARNLDWVEERLNDLNTSYTGVVDSMTVTTAHFHETSRNLLFGVEGFWTTTTENIRESVANAQGAMDEIKRQIEEIKDHLEGFMLTLGDQIAANVMETKKVAKAVAKAVMTAFGDMVEAMAKKAVTNTLIQEAETIGMLSISGLMNPANWLKIGPALAKGAATIALIKMIRAKFGFATGGVPPHEVPIITHEGERIINPQVATAGGYGASYMARGVGGAEYNVNMGGVTIRETADVDRIFNEIERRIRGLSGRR